MTAPDSKQPARRTYASLRDERGFSTEAALSLTGSFTVSIKPMDVRTYWRQVSPGASFAKDALYEEVGQ